MFYRHDLQDLVTTRFDGEVILVTTMGCIFRLSLMFLSLVVVRAVSQKHTASPWLHVLICALALLIPFLIELVGCWIVDLIAPNDIRSRDESDE